MNDTRTGNRWTRYGEWADRGDSERARSLEILAPLDPWALYPGGGRQALWLAGWDERSVWGFDPQLDAYFAQMWRNPAAGDSDPDIWILGRGTAEGQPFAVSTARVLAHEVAMATGADLAEVVSAMLGIEPGGGPQGGLCSGTAGNQG